MCCGSVSREHSGQIRIVSRTSRNTISGLHKRQVTAPETLLVTDDVLFRWARIIQIAKIFPIMHTIRRLEQKLQTGVCRSCQRSSQSSSIDKTPLHEAKRQLAECSEEKARLVKEAAGIHRYQIKYHDLAGILHEIER